MTTDTTATEAMLLALDATIDPLATVGDFDTLAPILAEDFHYTHSTGHSQDKQEWIAGLANLAGKRERVTSGGKVQVNGDVAIAHGDLDVIWPDGRHATDRYVRVYQQRGGSWLLIWQRTFPAPDRPQPGS